MSQPEGTGLPAPGSFSMIVLARLAGCSAAGRELTAAASVLGLRWPLALAATLAGLSDPLTAIDDAAAAGLVTVEHGVTGPIGVFTHPLVRAAVYTELSLSRRAELHRRAAELAEDRRDALRHRIEAAPGADAQLTAAAAQLADRDAAAGSWAASARGYLWA
ncbi:MAG: helix-turn-helix transcriptional regulator, partial [Pseudonocardiaceae bacterium]